MDSLRAQGWSERDEVWEWTLEFNHYVMRQIDRLIDSTYWRLWDLPAMTALRLKIEFLFIENYDGYEIRNNSKPENQQFNKIKDHSYYLFNPISPFMSPYIGNTPSISESNGGDPLYEFSQLFDTQFIEGGSFSQEVKNEPQIKNEKVDCFSLKGF